MGGEGREGRRERWWGRGKGGDAWGKRKGERRNWSRGNDAGGREEFSERVLGRLGLLSHRRGSRDEPEKGGGIRRKERTGRLAGRRRSVESCEVGIGKGSTMGQN